MAVYARELRCELDEAAIMTKPTKDNLRRWYYDEELSQTEIGELIGKPQWWVSTRMRELDIAPGKRADLAGDARRVTRATYNTDHQGYEMWFCRCGSEMNSLSVHRLAAVAWHGYDEVKDRVVHHRNGITWDNREENLELMDDSTHKSHHANQQSRNESGRFV